MLLGKESKKPPDTFVIGQSIRRFFICLLLTLGMWFLNGLINDRLG